MVIASMFGIDECRVPGHRVRHAVDVVPSAGIEADEVLAQRGANLHQLEAGFDLLNQDVNLDRAVRKTADVLRARTGCRSTARLPRRSGSSADTEPATSPIRKPLVVVDDIKRRIGDGRGKAVAAGVADLPVVQVQPRARKILVVKVELLPPVGDDRLAEEVLAHSFISPATCSATFMNTGSPMDSELQVALVIQRHRRDLAERVFAVEHPAIGAGKQSVGDVANPVFDRGARPGGRSSALNPLALKICGISLPMKLPSRASLNLDRRSADGGVGIEEGDRLLSRARSARRWMRSVINRLRSASKRARASRAPRRRG